MRKLSFSILAAIVSLWSIFHCTAARAEWPAKVFAPYMYLGSGDSFKLTECDDACGLKHYTLAFIIAKQEQTTGDDGKKKSKVVEDADKHIIAAWDGRIAMDKDLYHDQIDAIRKRGGDVIVSFGGEAGTELAIAETDPEALEKLYQSIIDRYKFTWLDFDIEGKALGDMKANERRNEVLAKLQAKNPGLVISFTVPVDPNGVSRETKAMLTDAKAKGVKVHSANVMTMYFGPQHVKDKKLADVCIASAKKRTKIARRSTRHSNRPVPDDRQRGRQGSGNLRPRRRQSRRRMGRPDNPGFAASLTGPSTATVASPAGKATATPPAASNKNPGRLPRFLI